jgi:DNA-binding protein WhiA
VQSLSPELKEIARLRLDNPELTLRELAVLCDPPITRSGVNHRLKKLSKIAFELRLKENAAITRKGFRYE